MRSLLVLIVGALAAGCANGNGLERRMGNDGGRDGAALEAGSDAGAVDGGGVTCAAGEMRFCDTACGTRGISSCSDVGVLGPCVPPAEDCNDADDDCDGNVDETIAARACSSSCGGGTETCVAGHWMGCTASMPGVEDCNGMDDDCDSRIDEMLTRACSTSCGAGTETCAGGAYVSCTARSPSAETCNAADDDCDGRVDETVSRACANACGTPGTETCASGAFAGCTAPPPPAETCNAIDDDCDTRVDEDIQVAIYASVDLSTVRAEQPACPSTFMGGLDTCLSASKRWCAARAGCGAIGGAGFLGSTATTVRIACFGSHASERNVTFAELAAAYDAGFSEASAGLRVAQSYSNRWCRDHGFAAGVGPVEHASGAMVIDCLAADQADFVRVPTLDLILATSCDPTVYPDDFSCGVAADQVCRARRYRGGWGPVEWNDTDSYLVCFR